MILPRRSGSAARDSVAGVEAVLCWREQRQRDRSGSDPRRRRTDSLLLHRGRGNGCGGQCARQWYATVAEEPGRICSGGAAVGGGVPTGGDVPNRGGQRTPTGSVLCCCG